MQEVLNHPKVSHLVQDNTMSKRMPNKKSREIAYNKVLSTMNKIGDDDRSYVISKMGKDAQYIKSD